ncbi:MAG: hypothetical protein F4183_05130 [Rhodothermaceae bacterium]|nr:hypothetical protein [Gammaproteobacteria bacterium]MYF63860.1 hypothetical protein [Rhodothermaceae bacterium]MYK04550.1 hypothetical protein [Gammaproteobacteria bacterium]
MNYTPQIIETFKASSVERILIIDDAYDPPNFDPDFGGDMLDILSSANVDLREHVNEHALSGEDLEAAIDALNTNDLDDSAIPAALAALYRVFVETRADTVDPGGVFTAVKGAALDVLDPLVDLLHRCSNDPRVVKVGMGEAVRASGELQPDLIFMDFYLSPPERTTKDLTKGQWDGDRDRSINLLKSILAALAAGVPAVVLMSSQDVSNRKDAYLGRLENRVMGLRFGFLLKDWVQGRGQDLTATGDAADVLMDTSGSFEFGRTLETSLKAWKDGAEEALNQLYSELREFDVKDFAYLLRFRLYEEGEPFADYLEWFLGDSLRAIVDDRVDWNTCEFRRLNDRPLTEAIEGAHPFPSPRLASFFHRLRFNSRDSRPRGRFALGDLFVSPNHRSVRMVISPDCDLIPRNRKATHILTIGGSIRGLHEDHAWAGELIFHNSPKAIKWNYKDLMTHEFGACSSLQVDGKSYAYFASMRPMSAQTIQKAVLADLSRVGLAVPPTVDVGAPVKVYLKKKVGTQGIVEELNGLKESRAQVFMPRGGKDLKRRVLFTSRFFRELLARLQGLSEDDLLCDHRGYWRDWLAQAENVREAMLRHGLELPGEGLHKLQTSIGKPKKKSWIEIVVDISEDALLDLRGTDPLEQ